MALQLSQFVWRILSEETINSFELASLRRVEIARSSKTGTVCVILNPCKVSVLAYGVWVSKPAESDDRW